MSGIIFNKFWTHHTGSLPNALQLVRKMRSGESHVGWRINTHGYDGYFNHIGFHGGSGIITNRSLYFTGDATYAENHVVKAYDPADTAYIALSEARSALAIYNINVPPVVRKITIKFKNGVFPPNMLTVEVSDNTSWGGDGDWIPIVHLTNPANGVFGAFITIPIPLGISHGFEFGGVAKSDGTLEDCISAQDTVATEPLPSDLHGIIEFDNYDDLLSWKDCITRPCMFKTVDNGKIYVWEPVIGAASQSQIRELA